MMLTGVQARNLVFTLCLAIICFVSPGDAKGYRWKCNFETADGSSTICDLEQDKKHDRFDWTLWHGKTPSLWTGPKAAFNGEYYIYFEATYKKKGDDAKISFPPSKRTEEVKLTFRYHMFGFLNGILSVCIQRRGKCVENVWKKKGEQGKDWKLAEVVIPLKRNDWVGFRAIYGGGYPGDVAIDNIEVKATSDQPSNI